MDNMINLEVHFDRTVVTLLLPEHVARLVETAVQNGETVSVKGFNWIKKSEEVGTYTINGDRVNYLFGRPYVDTAW